MSQIFYSELVRLARSGLLATYNDVSPLIGLSMENEVGREAIARLWAKSLNANTAKVGQC